MMRKNKRNRDQLHAGQGLLEFALVMPLLLLLTMGIIDFGRIFYIYGASSNASREAVRIGATDPDNCAAIDKAARSQLAFIPPSDYTVQIAYDNGMTVKYTGCQGSLAFSPGDRVLVDVRANFAPLTPVISSMFPLLSLHYTSARTIAYSGSDVPPPPPPPASSPAASPTTPPTTPASATPPGATPVPTTPAAPTSVPPTVPPGQTPAPTVPPATVPAPTALPTPAAPVSPILECTMDKGNGTFTAYFGYNSENPTSVGIPVGTDNNFSPNPKSRGQPTTFHPGRTGYWPSAAFSVDFNGDPIVWTLKSGDQVQTATASRDSHPCSQQVFIAKEWYDANAKPTNPPSDLPITFTISAQSVLGVATCTYPSGSPGLACTYNNRKTGSRHALDNNGLWAPVGTTYTVTEVGLPPGWTGYVGVDTFTSNLGGYCVNGYGGYTKNCSHVVKNSAASLVVTFVEGYPFRQFGSGNRDVYARVYVTYASLPTSGVTVTFTRNGTTYTAMTNASGYACTTLGKSQDSGETVDVTATRPGYRSGNTSGVTAPMEPPGGGGCP